jgi:microcystin-dependent protein
MSDPFVAEIRMFGFNFAPTGWATCDGQLLPISQNTALFSLLGTFYGGDGKSTFALPNLQDSVPVHTGTGQGPGLSQWFLGEMTGSEYITLLDTEMPVHTHTLNARALVGQTDTPGPTTVPSNGTWQASNQLGVVQQYTTAAPAAQMNFNALTPAGGSLPHNNLMPYLVLNYCIAMQGVFPPRT